MKSLNLDVRLRRMSVHDPSTGCWNWKGSKRNGYGRLIIGHRGDGSRKSVSAHRLSFEVFIGGGIPDGWEVCHRCDNPACINPAHLFLGTRQHNVDDRETKGRNRPPSGTNNGRSKLSEADVLKIREMHIAATSMRALARQFHVDKSTIRGLLRGETWKHVSLPDPPTGASQ